MLEDLDLSLTLSKRAYKLVMHDLIQRMYELEHLAFESKVPVIILFEGWDAAGKGTAISMLTERLDPRGFKVLPTQAPRTHEMQKPWLWRFWMQIPRRGQMAIFDRSWYGRVLVERVKGLTPIPDWIRAYEEINGFERTLADDGIVMIKFWLHISREEQLRRFIDLTQDPETAWQITAEDWDNHREYDEYLAAVKDMLANTNTSAAPWTVVPANHRHYKTYVIFSTIISKLEDALDMERTEWKDLATLEAEAAKKKRTKKEKKGKRVEADAALVTVVEEIAVEEIIAEEITAIEVEAEEAAAEEAEAEEAEDIATEEIQESLVEEDTRHA